MSRLKMYVIVMALMAVAACSASFAGERRELSYDWKLRAAYPALGDEDIDADIANWLEKHLNTLIKEMNDVIVIPDLPAMNSEIGVDYSVSRASNRALSVVFKSYVYPARAAHGTTRAAVVSYDIERKTLLAFEELFGKPDVALEILSREAQNILAGDLKQKKDASSADDLTWFKDGFAPERDNFENIVLEPYGIRVIFQQYQVLPYVYGLPEAFFPLEMLAPAEPNYALWGKEKPE